MHNKYKSLLFFLFYITFNAQVGINTTTPKSTLDVNGDVALRNALSVGGTDTTNGSVGSVDQILVSQGTGLPAVWKYANVPFMENSQYKLINTYLKNDETGITTLSNGVAVSTPAVSSLNEDFDGTKWMKITNLTTTLNVKSAQNKITYQVQSGVELVNKTVGNGASVNYICGIFKANKLVAMRPDGIIAVDTNPVQGIFTLNYTEENVPIGTYTMDVACRKIAMSTPSTDTYFRIGINVPTYGPAPVVTNTTSNAFTLKSHFKVDIAELVTYTN
ncbi:hypothetical protein H0S70_13020 [Chryseobacterium manosquense]|uniref:Uncharacterized protein n=1 Tax=Chryseobacterium manosquense TaxID=2754694 RepID=A0A7H1DW73_9FLAO|nr:hypothetical protein [Chryseobacterium manosquense]QNS41231.1 hypothetical protein H0S70_13020 [Chryseobacterium manosquense]